MKYDAMISQYGNSYIIFLPKRLCIEEGWRIGDIVNVELKRIFSKPDSKPFTISGKKFFISKQDIINCCIKGKIPYFYYGNKNVKYCIMINGIRYPIKWVLGEVIKMNPALFTSDYAKRILKKLGFEIRDDWDNK